ncbi:hypothetical protein BDV06DRAFT_229886 [Aspergillus oleicola]
MAESKPVVGILSIGEMGLGIADLLVNHGYQVATFAEDRSEQTRERAKSINITLLPSIADLVVQSNVILSIVPPKDSFATAQRIHENTPTETRTKKGPLYYLDLNATSPTLAKETFSLLSSNNNIIYIDGGIIGGPPSKISHKSHSTATNVTWNKPSLVTSGPIPLTSTPVYNELTSTLNIEHISSSIGSASGTKLCFASTTKGFFAIAIQAFVTAERMGVTGDLRRYMERHNAATLQIVERGVVGMPSKAWRWVGEMHMIGECMQAEGGFGRGLFDEIAEVYRVVAEDTALGQEQAGNRQRGKTVDDVVSVICEGMDATRRGKEKAD